MPITSQAQAHRFQAVLNGDNTRMPGVTKEQAAEILRGVDINALPVYAKVQVPKERRSMVPPPRPPDER